MIITGVDTETTGLDQASGHRIIEICMRVYDGNTRELKIPYLKRVNPQRSIDPKAREVHGISVDDLVGEPTWDVVAPQVQKIMRATDVMIAHNMMFDGPFIAMELDRIGLEVPSVATYCTMTNGRWATPLGKSPKLQELCFALGVDYDPAAAHAADYDVDRMMECLWLGIDQGFYELPKIEKGED